VERRNDHVELTIINSHYESLSGDGAQPEVMVQNVITHLNQLDNLAVKS